jgi:putative hydrolase of the HAD superfamily
MTRNLRPGAADALLFDLGRVVIDIDFERTVARWADHAGCIPADLAARFSRDDVYQRHERGEIDDVEFFGTLRAALGIDLSDAQLLDGWNATFIGEIPGITPLLARAGRRVPLDALSNTNPAHVTYFSRHFAELLRHFRELFLSSRIGLRKPDAAAFDHVVSAIGIEPERIVFFDDLIENVEGARACGLIAVQVRSSEDVARALDALGL